MAGLDLTLPRFVFLLCVLAVSCSDGTTPAATTPPPSPTGTPAPTVDAGGTPLRPHGDAPAVDGADAACEDFPGKDVQDCTFAREADPPLAAVYERRETDSVVGLWAVTVWSYDLATDRWIPRSRAQSEPDLWAFIGGTTTPIGPGEQVLVVGYRYAGTGQILDYDIIGGDAQVLARRGGLSHGSVQLSEERIVDFAADYPNQEPNCCPPRFARTEIRWQEGQFRITDHGFVEPDAVPPSDL